MDEILVVGGAGYIGSHMCKYLAGNGCRPIVLDNLSLGHRQAVQWGPLYTGEMDDSVLLKQIFSRHAIKAVMHFAALCYVGESVYEPLKYYRNNISATLGLVAAMQVHGVNKLIFSSTCATYGEPDYLPITEDHPQRPINPYGRSKLMMEQIFADLDVATGLQTVCLRYFNAAGADPDGELGEDHNPETHLLPLVLQAAQGRCDGITVFGSDYSTPDGTCIRDYIHVHDLAQAHFLSLQHLLQEGASRIYNLGNGSGYSILDVLAAATRVTGRKIAYRFAERRAGDPATLVGSAEKIIEELDWQPKYGNLDKILETAWNWHNKYPDGYSL
jgi:UDP-glucose-4-epimerase GalE